MLALVAFALPATAQHLHLNVGAQSQAQNSPLFFQNGAAFVTNSGFVMPMPMQPSGDYAGHFATAALSPTAIGAGFFDDPAPGTQVRLRFVAVSGPPGGEFRVWDSDGSGPAGTITFGVPVGTTNGADSILLSENSAEPGADPFGHIHGRAFSATLPGLYVVGVQAYDNSNNGTPSGSIHAPSELLPIYFQAGVTVAGITRGDNQTVITFASRFGRSYYVQATGTPENSASWQDIAGPFTGDLLQTTTDGEATGAARFYRLRVTTP